MISLSTGEFWRKINGLQVFGKITGDQVNFCMEYCCRLEVALVIKWKFVAQDVRSIRLLLVADVLAPILYKALSRAYP